MDALIIKLRKRSEDIYASVYIYRAGVEAYVGDLDGLTLKDVEWFVLSNTSEHSTPLCVEVI